MKGACTDKKAEKKKRKRKEEKPRTSRQYNDQYVERSRRVFALIHQLAYIYDDKKELAEMNRNKRGAPYQYTNNLIAMVSRVKTALNLDFRSCEGMLADALPAGCPYFTTIFRRVNAQSVAIKESLSNIEIDDVGLNLVPDGTGMLPSTRSEYVRIVHHLKRGFLRLTIMINKDTLEIVAFHLTESSVGEVTVFEELLHDALVNMGVDINERIARVQLEKPYAKKSYEEITIMADGAYDTRKIFSLCKKLGITTNIRVRTNANAKAGGVDRARSEKVLEQLGGSPDTTPAELKAMTETEREANRKKWKEDVKYGTRWLVEIVFSAFKRNYGDAVSARKIENIRRELALKICEYNTMLRIREVCMKS